MKLVLANVRENRTPKNKEMQALIDLYIASAARYLPCETTGRPHPTSLLDESRGREKLRQS